MELSKQVCSLDLSKRLKELEVKQESLFWWVPDQDKQYWDVYPTEFVEAFEAGSPTRMFGARYLKVGGYKLERYSAFTVAELGQLLPQILTIKKTRYQLFVSVALDKQWFVVYANENDYHDNAPIKFMMDHNEADARAKMLIYLLENKLITL